ncbi:MAG TPA: cytochrome b/b6 domain-containing protein [Candidatus Lustribacter sp.]|jgi:thiosulfate reductase cytochrome b subunit|nr:cytochrome b/b6 domain-containing protein [Candidatus Lustribacter sp.]
MSEPHAGQRVYRHSITARVTHWLWALAMLVLFMSGLQIFNAAPYLDASDKSDPTHRVLSFEAHQAADGKQVGTTTIFGHTFTTTNVLGYTDDGQGGETERAFPGWITLPATQDLADGRTWHFFFGWVLVLSLMTYLIAGMVRKDLRELILRPSDLPKLLPMQLYYFRLRKEPPPHGTYNPLQKAAYTVVLFVFFPLIILTGLALSPGIDAITNPLVWVLGGRQFARTWHFVLMALFFGYFLTHMVLVFSTGAWNNIKSMFTGWYQLKDHDGVGI